jgi:hypothetical protein
MPRLVVFRREAATARCQTQTLSIFGSCAPPNRSHRPKLCVPKADVGNYEVQWRMHNGRIMMTGPTAPRAMMREVSDTGDRTQKDWQTVFRRLPCVCARFHWAACVVLFAASSMTSAITAGCVKNSAWLASTSVTFAPMRLAMSCSMRWSKALS